MWTFASFHAVSQCSPCPSVNPPRIKRRQNIYITRKKLKKKENIPALWKSELNQKENKNVKNKPRVTEPDVDLTPMHIPCISGDVSKFLELSTM